MVFDAINLQRLIVGKDKDEGVIAVQSGSEQIRLFSTALHVLQDYYLGKYPTSMRIAAASTADTPLAVSIGRAALQMLEILPGVTVMDAFQKNWEKGFTGNMQIGRSPPLCSDKSATHFPILMAETKIPYNRMLFFDDCLWGDHCSRVKKRCPGVVTVRTPDGLTDRDWKNGLISYAQAHL